MPSIQQMLDKLHIRELSDMQRATYEALSSSTNDVILLSPTGSGKTLAYLLPLVGKLSADSDMVQAVVVVPGRELALQSATVMRDMGSGLRTCACYGGRAAMDEHRMLKQVRPHVVFGTPGRLVDHLEKANIAADGIKYLVIDEFDKCLAMGFRDEMSRLLQLLPHIRQRVLLSATDSSDIALFTDVHRATRLDYLAAEETRPGRVTLYQVHSPQKDKLDTLGTLLSQLGQQSSLVFMNYRESVERTTDYLRGLGFVTSGYHGGMDQRSREDALYRFLNKSANVLVATDLASRGLDIPMIDNIIHYQLPTDEQSYIHRIGRTARWDACGRAFFLLGPTEQLPSYVGDAVTDFPLDDRRPTPPSPLMATLYIGKGKKDKISKGDIVGFLCKQGGLRSSEIGRIDVRDRYTYVAVSRQRAQQALSRVQGEKIKGIHTVVEPVK